MGVPFFCSHEKPARGRGRVSAGAGGDLRCDYREVTMRGRIIAIGIATAVSISGCTEPAIAQAKSPSEFSPAECRDLADSAQSIQEAIIGVFKVTETLTPAGIFEQSDDGLANALRGLVKARDEAREPVRRLSD